MLATVAATVIDWQDGLIIEAKLWDAKTGRELHNLRGHTHRVSALAFSPDGKQAATGSVDATVRIWDVAAGAEVKVLRGHTSGVHAVAFTPDGRRVASCSDHDARIWDVATGQELHTYRGHTRTISNLQFSPDGRVLWTAAWDNTAKAWDAFERNDYRTIDGPYRLIGADSAGGLLMLSGPLGSLAFCDPATGFVQRSYAKLKHQGDVPSGPSPGGRYMIEPQTGFNRAVVSRDGAWLATATSGDRTVKVWMMSDGELHAGLVGHAHGIHDIAFSPDGRLVASASMDATARLWDRASGREVRTLVGHKTELTTVAFSPDGRLLATGSIDMTVKLWSVPDGVLVRTLVGHTFDIRGLTFSPDGSSVVSAGDSTIRIWDVATGRERHSLRGHTGYVNCFACSPDGRRLASGGNDGRIRLWDVESGIEVFAISVLEADEAPQKMPTNSAHGNDRVEHIVFSADGKHLVAAVADGTIRVWDADANGPNERAVREALSYLNHWHRADAPLGDLERRARDDKSISESVRERALALAAPFARAAEQRRAWAVVAKLFGEKLRREEVAKRLRADTSLSVAVREEALALAARWPEAEKGRTMQLR